MHIYIYSFGDFDFIEFIKGWLAGYISETTNHLLYRYCVQSPGQSEHRRRGRLGSDVANA